MDPALEQRLENINTSEPNSIAIDSPPQRGKKILKIAIIAIFIISILANAVLCYFYLRKDKQYKEQIKQTADKDSQYQAEKAIVDAKSNCPAIVECPAVTPAATTTTPTTTPSKSATSSKSSTSGEEVMLPPAPPSD